MISFKIVLYMLTLATVSADKVEAGANPMGKVIELLEIMSKEIVTDQEKDSKAYKEETALYKKDSARSKKVLKEHGEKIAQLQSDLKEAEAFREKKQKDHEKMSNAMAKDSAELDKGRKARAERRSVFETNEATWIKAIDELNRALEVMGKKAPATDSASASSLVSVAQNIRRTLIHDSTISLSTLQRETLNSFVRSATVLAESRSSPPTSFLQSGSRSRDQVDVFKMYGGGSGGVIATLQKVLNDVKKESDKGRKEETKDKEQYTKWGSELETFIDAQKKSLSDMKAAIAQSQQESSLKEASLLESKRIYDAEDQHVKKAVQNYRKRTEDYKNRLAKRQDEAIAMHEAQRILNSEVGKLYMKKQTVGKLVKVGASLLQTSQEKSSVRRKLLHVLRTAPTPGLALLALKSTVRYRAGAQANPFTKVKAMIKGMLDKLVQEQAASATHKAWCDEQMGRTAKSRKRKQADIQKMKDRLEALQADLDATKIDINATKKDFDAMKATVSNATSLRAKEHKNGVAAIKMYKNAVKLLTNAARVLKKWYKNADKSTQVDDKGLKQRRGAGTGVVAMLEIALDDFKGSHQAAVEAERLAALDFEKLQSESKIRMAVFQKDLEYNSRAKVKAEFDQSTMQNDLKSYVKQLASVDSYSKQLDSQCIARVDTYAVKKAKREAELKSLKEALASLQGAAR